jgi:hypothetical protein
MSLSELRASLRTACNEAGSVALWCARNDISHTYVRRVLAMTEEPGPKLLRKMGLRLVKTYEAIT